MIRPKSYSRLVTHLSTSVEIAAELRCRAGQKSPPFSTTKIIETCFPSTLVTGGPLPLEIHEIVSKHRWGATIVYRRSLSGPEQRFAIAHAIAHLLFDDESACMRPGRAGIVASEERADAFAAELLVPLDVLRASVTRWPSPDAVDQEIYLDHVDENASRFGVPAYIIDERIRQLASTYKIANH